jgi:ABC-type multidrug transport system fused ATPase/permease subunit
VHLLQSSSDCILVLKSGVLCERGSYSDLMSTTVFKALIGQSETKMSACNNGSPSSDKQKLSPAQGAGDDDYVDDSDEAVLASWDGKGQTTLSENNTVSFGGNRVRTESHGDTTIADLRAVLLAATPQRGQGPSEAVVSDFRAVKAYGATNSEEREELDLITSGKIDRSVYSAYFRAAGIGLCVVVFISTACMQASSSLYAFWLAYYVNNHDREENRITHAQFVGISAAIVGVNIVFACLRSVLFALGGLRAAERLYNQLTQSVFQTTLYFFETTSFGKIINRFAKVRTARFAFSKESLFYEYYFLLQDTNCIDDQLPFIMNILLAQVFLVLGSFVVISITDPIVSNSPSVSVLHLLITVIFAGDHHYCAGDAAVLSLATFLSTIFAYAPPARLCVPLTSVLSNM